MREIKFRAWDKEKSTMIYDSEGEYPDIANEDYIRITNMGVLFADAPDMGYYGGGDWSEKRGEFQIMQYTGLKDRNGVDIYEGDVIKNVNGDRKYIVAWDVNEAAFYGEMIGRKDGNYISWERFEVIGNKFEHPNLIREEQ